jgi:N utilization substance protein B
MGRLEKELFHSIDKTFELYHLLLLLIPELSRHASSRIELARLKKQPSESDLNPNTKFVENRIIKQIAENNSLSKFRNKLAIGWVQYPEFIKKLYNEISKSEPFEEYMASVEDSYEVDRKLVLKLLSKVIIVYPDLYDYLEEQSIYWNDEVDFVIGMIIKTVKKFRKEDGKDAELMQQFKNQDDIGFTKDLFRKSIKHHKNNLQLIEKFSENWEIERIAFMDILIMNMAITEFVEFIDVPLKVSLNEYIEISKSYSTDKSSTFINGVLDKVIAHLKAEKKILKRGRGLIGEV